MTRITSTLRFFVLLGCGSFFIEGYAQHNNLIKANLIAETHSLEIQQEFVYQNSTKDTLKTLYFNDWANAYSDKNTALAKRFAEEFRKSLHLASPQDRGYTQIHTVVDGEFRNLSWSRTRGKDLIKIELSNPIAPGAAVKLYLTYTVQLPPNRYTPFGYGSDGSYYLKDWYLTPSVYDSSWKLYANKNLEDLYTDISDTRIEFSFPKDLFLGTNYVDFNLVQKADKQQATLRGINRKSCDLILNRDRPFKKHLTESLFVITDIRQRRFNDIQQGISINRISNFVVSHLGPFPFDHLLVSEVDFNKNPLYGLNQLPSFIRPYDEQFQFEMKFLKTALISYIKETLFMDPRADKWVSDAIINYLMIRYVATYYPDQKLFGNLASRWPIRTTTLGKMDFVEQYPFLFMWSARQNFDQALTTPNDSLIKFNQKIGNTYKAGLGLVYLSDYLEGAQIDNGIKEFYTQYANKKATPKDFQNTIEKFSDKPIDWFFDTYVATDKRIDFTITSVNKSSDSLAVSIKNKTGVNVPISLFGLASDTVVSKYWLTDISGSRAFKIPNLGEDRLVLNYGKTIPEFNQRDNWKSLGGFFSSNKKLKLQFFKDAEDPYYNQVFYMPVANYNLYDGISPGIRFTNKTFLQRPFIFDISPTYALNENDFVGYGRFTYQKYHNKSGLYMSRYSIGGSTSHFQTKSRYSTLTPSIVLAWRPADLISNIRSSLLLRYVNVFRDIDPALGNLETSPDYRILNLRYNYRNNGIINYFSWFADGQHAQNFSKVSINMEYRQLFESNRQVNLRLFGGYFMRNNTASNFYSFALDRPTDYLFDYDYLGRSEEKGLYSQQIIIAEGGFKSKLENPYSNHWMITANGSFNLWRWIEVFADAGFMNNKNLPTRFVYDAGLRLNLVTDYFELYLPFYSNNGWEISSPNYSERIRFIITLSPKTLTGLFTRKWF
ncbi:MAG: hypothetical protein RLZZ241_1875 [Bacteroidota bacterium]|jgi:hypothetical protein